LAIDEDIGWFQISMHDSFLVHVCQSTGDLMNIIPDLSFFKVDILLNCLLDQ
jgi:hypothetical protein